MHDKTIDLAEYRINDAEERLDTAKSLLSLGKYKDALNRSYYAIFNAMRAVLALDNVDFKKHSGVISYFRKEYIKTGIFESELSAIIEDSFNIRQDSDYNDFFVASKEDAEIQVSDAENFFNIVSDYINNRIESDNEES